MSSTATLQSDEITAIKAAHKEATHTTIIHDRVAAYHKLTHKVDVRQLHDTAWRVNVYVADDNIIPKITLPYSYYVKLNSDGSLKFDPPLGLHP